MEIIENDKPIDIISLRRKHNSCQHQKIFVDDSLNEIICQLCGERINPIWWLKKWADEESFLEFRRDRLQEVVDDIEKKEKVKNRCKCEHCGKMTKIDKRGF